MFKNNDKVWILDRGKFLRGIIDGWPEHGYAGVKDLPAQAGCRSVRTCDIRLQSPEFGIVTFEYLSPV